MRLTEAALLSRLGSNCGLGGWWRAGTVYERTKPREPCCVDLGPLRRREANAALDKALFWWHWWAATGVLWVCHAASIRDAKRC